VHRRICLPEGGSLGAEQLSGIAREFRRALDWAAAEKEILFPSRPLRARAVER
jgi:hypothetical protein